MSLHVHLWGGRRAVGGSLVLGGGFHSHLVPGGLVHEHPMVVCVYGVALSWVESRCFSFLFGLAASLLLFFSMLTFVLSMAVSCDVICWRTLKSKTNTIDKLGSIYHHLSFAPVLLNTLLNNSLCRNVSDPTCVDGRYQPLSPNRTLGYG